MKSYYLQHVPFEGPGYIDTFCREKNISLKQTALYRGDAFPSPDEFDILFVMGGPMGIHDTRLYPWLTAEKKFIEISIRAGKKIVGICLGAQLIADVLGASVTRNKEKEIGWFPVENTVSPDAPQTLLWPESFHAFHWHGDTFAVPSGARHAARSEACENQAFIYNEQVLALQFHLESTGASIEDLLTNCADELKPGPWVQTSDEIRDPTYISDSNTLMKHILTSFAAP